MKKLEVHIKNDIAIIEWNVEKLLGGPDSLKLGEAVKNVIDQNIKKIIINFSKVKWTDSTGLGILVSAWKIAVSNNAELVVVFDSVRFENIFRVTNLKAIMRTYRSIDDAMKHYSE